MAADVLPLSLCVFFDFLMNCVSAFNPMQVQFLRSQFQAFPLGFLARLWLHSSQPMNDPYIQTSVQDFRFEPMQR
jgi:hypothetical protein